MMRRPTCALIISYTILSSVVDAFEQNFLYATVLGHGYDKAEMPVNVPVAVNLEIKYVSNIDSKTGVLDMQLVFRTWWHDPRLAYPAANAHANSPLMVHKKDVWFPSDLGVITAKTSEPVGGTGDYVQVSPEGEMFSSAVVHTQIICPMDPTKFPFDTQTCLIHVESWMHSMNQVNVTYKELPLGLVNHGSAMSSEFQLIDGGVRQASYVADATGLEYGTIFYILKLKRYPDYYVSAILMPSCMLLILAWAGLFLSRDAVPARVGLNITVMLTLGALRIPTAQMVPGPSPHATANCSRSRFR